MGKNRQPKASGSNKAKNANKNSKSTVKKTPRPSISTISPPPVIWQPPPPRPIEDNPLLWSSGINTHGEGDWQLAIDCIYGSDDDLPCNRMTLPLNAMKRIK